MAELNIKSSTVEAGIDLAKTFLTKLVGPSLDELGLLINDHVRLFRLGNQMKMLEKTKTKAEKYKIPLRQLNLKVILPLLEGVAYEEDDKVQDVWANLLTNYIDDKDNLMINVYPALLSQLSSNEIEILLALEEEFVIDIKSSEYSKSHFLNLERLGLVVAAEEMSNNVQFALLEQFEKKMRERGVTKNVSVQFFSGHLSASLFGLEFINAISLKSRSLRT